MFVSDHPVTASGPAPTSETGLGNTGTVALTSRRDVASTFVSFGLLGMLSGGWFARIPAARDHLDAELSTVGLVLLCMGLGSFATMPFGGRLSHRFSSRRVCMIAAVAAALFYCLLPFTTSPVVFGLLLFGTGAAIGCWEVMLNVHGADVERRSQRSIMPALHGLWSAGVMVGSALGAVLAAAGVTFGQQFWLTFPLIAIVSVIAASGWRDHRTRSADGGRPSRPSMRALSLPVVLLALMLVCSNTGEGTASDWLALYVHDERGIPEGLAAAAFTAYSLASTTGRLLGGFVVDRLGPLLTLRLSGLITAAGIGTVIFLPSAVGPYLGAALWGLGLATIFPVAITIAGRHGGDNSAGAISAVTTIGFGAFLTAPPLIGFVADHASIGFALGLVMVAALGVPMLAGLAIKSPTSVRTR